MCYWCIVEVRQNKLALLTQLYDAFTDSPSETIIATFEKFNVLMKKLMAYKKVYNNVEVNRKFMRSLLKMLDPKTTVIREIINLKNPKWTFLYLANWDKD